MNLFKRKTSEELIEETKRLEVELNNLKIKNKIVRTHKQVKKELNDNKREQFENSIAGKVLKGLKKEINKKQKKNKSSYKPVKKKKIEHKETKYVSPLLR